MRTSSQNSSFSSIPAILLTIFAYLIIPSYSAPVQTLTPTQIPLAPDDASGNTDSNSDGKSGSPDRMEVMNWILAAISIVIVIELIFWLFKCINMVRKGVPGNEGDMNDGGFQNRGSDTTSNGPDDEYLPPYDGLSLPKYCEAMDMNDNAFNNGDNEQLRSSHLVEDEDSTTTIVADQENNNEGHEEEAGEASESDTVEISRVSNHTSTVVVEMNQVSNIVVDSTEQPPPIEEVSEVSEVSGNSSKTQEI